MDVLTKLALKIASASALFALFGCGGSEDGLPIESSIVKVALTATSTDTGFVAVGNDDASYNIEEIGMAFSTIELVPCSSDAAPIAHRDYPADLALEPPSSANFESGVSDYCSMRIGTAPSREPEPAVLEGLGCFVRGTRMDGVPFEIRSELTLDLDLVTLSGSAFDSRELALAFNLEVWFAEVDLFSATVNDGVILVDSSSNQDLLAMFEANAPGAAALYADANRDGFLGYSEVIATNP